MYFSLRAYSPTDIHLLCGKPSTVSVIPLSEYPYMVFLYGILNAHAFLPFKKSFFEYVFEDRTSAEHVSDH